jgi:hypothetical protein
MNLKVLVSALPGTSPDRTGRRPVAAALLLIIIHVNVFAVVGQQNPVPQPSPALEAERQRLEQENAILKLEKERAELKKAIRDAAPSASVTPLEGKTTVSDKVNIEANIMAYNVMSDIAFEASKHIRNKIPGAQAIAIYNQKEVRDWRFYQAMFPAFEAELNRLIKEYDRILKESVDEATARSEMEKTPLGAEVLTLGPIREGLLAGSSVVRSVIDLMSLFRTNTEIAGVEVTPDEGALVSEMLRGLKAAYNDRITIYVPAIIPPHVLPKSPTLKLVRDAYDRRAASAGAIRTFERVTAAIAETKDKSKALEAEVTKMADAIKKNQEAIAKNSQEIAVLERKLRRARSESQRRPLREAITALNNKNEGLKTENKKLTNEKAIKAIQKAQLDALVKTMEELVASAKDRVPHLKTLNEQFDKFIGDFVKLDAGTGVNALALFVKAENLDAALKGESYWLAIRGVKAGGNNRTRRNLIRYFSGSKLDHSGGFIIEYSLYSREGAVIQSDKFAKYGGYMEPKKIRELKDR